VADPAIGEWGPWGGGRGATPCPSAEKALPGQK